VLLFSFLKQQKCIVRGEVGALGLEEVLEGCAEEGLEVEEGLEGSCCGLGVFDLGEEGGDKFGGRDASGVEVFFE